MPNKILIPLQSLVSSFIEPLWTGEQQWVQLCGSGRGSSSLCPKGSTICWAPVAVAQVSGGFSVPNLLCAVIHGVAKSRTRLSGWTELNWIFFVLRIRPVKTVSTGQVFNRFSGRLWRAFLSMFSPMLFPPVLQLPPLPGFEPSQNPWCLDSGSNEAQVLMSHCKNQIETQLGKRWVCLDSESSTLLRVWAITEGKCWGLGMWCG